jgi:hypothetical protein
MAEPEVMWATDNLMTTVTILTLTTILSSRDQTDSGQEKGLSKRLLSTTPSISSRAGSTLTIPASKDLLSRLTASIEFKFELCRATVIG